MKCCDTPSAMSNSPDRHQCPQSGDPGKRLDTITLKSLLTPNALRRLESKHLYLFCADPDCGVVYFSPEGDSFSKSDLKVPVFQKDPAPEVPVCYCFGWTRQKIWDEITQTGKSTATESITKDIQAGRCGCEVNNPQGSCCLGNVNQIIKAELHQVKKEARQNV